ncbi:zinc ABC transporter substrate-binding protein [Okibacterium endophyticum]
MKKSYIALALIPAAALVLSACSGTADAGDGSGLPQVVASTNVYGDVAEAIAGEYAEVTSIITSGAQDPHSYEASAQDQLALSKADIVIENGGGYDPFIDTLLEAADHDAEVLSASELSGLMPGDAAEEHDHEHTDEADADATGDAHAGHDHIEGFNEHVWYSPAAIENLARELAHALGEAAPEHAQDFDENLEAFAEQIHGLEEQAEQLSATVDGAGALVTEPVPGYLLEASGFTDLTPPEFSEAIEEGTDVSPAVLSETLQVVESGDVRLLAYNEQTSSAETERVLEAAEDAGVAVVSFTETLPDGEDYVSWMTANLDAIAEALA